MFLIAGCCGAKARKDEKTSSTLVPPMQDGNEHLSIGFMKNLLTIVRR